MRFGQILRSRGAEILGGTAFLFTIVLAVLVLAVGDTLLTPATEILLSVVGFLTIGLLIAFWLWMFSDAALDQNSSLWRFLIFGTFALGAWVYLLVRYIPRKRRPAGEG